ncbi:hypothetical protein ZOSMA_241G00090 [Zostera marina]|uniref:Uncharacterized protein n=1 Tax=Zostera marina TaxID=29655 RepID=A0A0K9PJ77_ZOSMR|nr:hypothetical protein ZOSMA_241G00090 [Zostera marina]
MNFLMRGSSNQSPTPAAAPKVRKSVAAPIPESKVKKSLEGFFAEEDPREYTEGKKGGFGIGVSNAAKRGKFSMGGSHVDVIEEEGWISILKTAEGLPEDWSDVVDATLLRSSDRSFVFPGEQLRILVYLATSKQDSEDTEFIDSSRVLEEISSVDGSLENGQTNLRSRQLDVDIDNEHNGVNGVVTSKDTFNSNMDLSKDDTLIQIDHHKQKTESLLARFEKSYYFVRFAESDEPLWSKKMKDESNDSGSKNVSSEIFLNSNIDSGSFHGCTSGGLSTSSAKCHSLSNGDIVVILHVNVGVDSIKDYVLEVLQFVKSEVRHHPSERRKVLKSNNDPNGELLRWVFPLDNSLAPPPVPRSIVPVPSSVGGYNRPSLSTSSGSPLFSFSNFRSHSMSSLNQITSSSSSHQSYPKSRSVSEDFDHFSSEKSIVNHDLGIEGHLSFRGVRLEPEQFSVQCGLEGVYLPGKKWRKKLEIIQPIEIHSFTADCNTENLLCVQIKNICPIHVPDAVIYLDTINVIFEEAPKSDLPLSLPVSCIEAGNDHSLPNLPLRRGEEHSFILKPSALLGRAFKDFGDKSPLKSNITKLGGGGALHSTKFAVLVSYRCNYTESKMFFKKATSWQPRGDMDLMISVTSEMSEQKEIAEPEGGAPRLPVQVLNLQASNLTSEDLTLMILAPSSFTMLPSFVSLSPFPTSPVPPLADFPEFRERLAEKSEGNSSTLKKNSSTTTPGNEKDGNNTGIKSATSLSVDTTSRFDVVPDSNLGSTHLWLQSEVPLGCVPAQSSATIKLQLLPLTDGIISLDTLQVKIQEKGVIYTPGHSLKIHTTSSIATAIA